jgi:iron complex outermembrane receptor protein
MTTKLHPLRAPACIAAAAFTLAIPSLQAQVTPTLRETRVTATRFAEPEQSLPLGVSVITADEIRASGATNVTEAIMRLLGVVGRQDFFGGGEYSLDLRGFGPTADNNQVVVLDGIRISESDLSAPRLAGIPIEAIERIEVLRGSGAVLYGEGATAGVIVITTKAGHGRQQPNGATVYSAAGSDGLLDVRAGANVSTANGFALEAHGQKRESDGFRQNSRSDVRGGLVTGQWSNEWLRIGGRIGEDSVKARLPGGLTAAQYAADPRQTTTPNDRAAIRSERAALFAQAELGAWQVGFDAARRDKQLRSTNGAFAFDYDVEVDTWGLRARHEGRFAGAANTLVLGADASDWRRQVLGAFGSVATQRAHAFYAKDDITFASGTRLSLGGRTERIRKDNDTFPPSGFSDRVHAWELGASHPVADGWTAYARVGSSFRLANVDEFNFTTPGLELRPQKSRDIELGTRWNYTGGNLQARLYRSALTDEIGFDPNAIGPNSPFGFNGANINFDPTRRQGLELDWQHAVTASVGMRVNAAWRAATFRAGPYAGNDVPLTPRRTLAVRADYVLAPGHRVTGGVNWVSSQHPDFNNACRMPSYVTADARYAWQFHARAELAVGVTNLFDRNYYTQAFACAGGQPSSLYPEAGRQVTASLRLQF